MALKRTGQGVFLLLQLPGTFPHCRYNIIMTEAIDFSRVQEDENTAMRALLLTVKTLPSHPSTAVNVPPFSI